MDAYVIRAMTRWPDVPAVYGWLALDRRGDWRIKGERLSHRKAVAFINRNYAADEHGRWYFQNGPQRVYVQLEYTPWVYRLAGDGELHAHTGEAVDGVKGAFLDDDGNLLLHTANGIGIVDDRDLAALSVNLNLRSNGASAEQIEAALVELQSGNASDLVLRWRGRRHNVEHLKRAEVESRFGFDPDPRAEAKQSKASRPKSVG